MRQPIIAANWKMHLGREGEALELVRRIRPRLTRVTGVEIVLCPPFTVLADLERVLRRSSLALGAQNVHWELRGPHTGEVSAEMLAPLCRYVIVGHSERRAAGGAAEDDRSINLKVHAALSAGLVPILCVGEAVDVRRAGRTDGFVSGQVSAAMAGLEAEQVARCVVAYEPIWAIGSGDPATPIDANRTIALAVRQAIADGFGGAAADAVRVLYGGSVTAENIADFMSMPEIDGALVGGASLQPGFVDLVRAAVPR